MVFSSRIEIHGFIKFGQTTGEKTLQAAYRQIPLQQKDNEEEDKDKASVKTKYWEKANVTF